MRRWRCVSGTLLRLASSYCFDALDGMTYRRWLVGGSVGAERVGRRMVRRVGRFRLLGSAVDEYAVGRAFAGGRAVGLARAVMTAADAGLGLWSGGFARLPVILRGFRTRLVNRRIMNRGVGRFSTTSGCGVLGGGGCGVKCRCRGGMRTCACSIYAPRASDRTGAAAGRGCSPMAAFVFIR